MSTPSSAPGRAAASGSTISLVGLFVVALALRPQLSAVGPLAQGMIDDLGTTHAELGLLTAVPVLCMGLFAPFGPPIARWVGARGGIAVSVAALIAFGLARALAPSFPALLVVTLGVGVMTAIVGPMLPMFVRGRLPDRMVAGTASYAAGTNLGAALATALAVPLTVVPGDWRGSLVALSAASLVSLGAWLVLSRPRSADVAHPAEPRVRPTISIPHLPLGRLVAWAIGLLFGLQSWLFYGTTAWMASVYVEQGWPKEQAGLLLTVVLFASLSGITVVPWLSRRGGTRRAILAGAAVSSATGLLGICLVPGPAVPWAILLGLGLGSTFTLVLTLPTDISADPREAGGAAALMFLVGYLLASLAPFVMGAVRDATGSFAASLWLLVAIAVAMVPLGWSMSPQRLHPATRR